MVWMKHAGFFEASTVRKGWNNSVNNYSGDAIEKANNDPLGRAIVEANSMVSNNIRRGNFVGESARTFL